MVRAYGDGDAHSDDGDNGGVRSGPCVRSAPDRIGSNTGVEVDDGDYEVVLSPSFSLTGRHKSDGNGGNLAAMVDTA